MAVGAGNQAKGTGSDPKEGGTVAQGIATALQICLPGET